MSLKVYLLVAASCFALNLVGCVDVAPDDANPACLKYRQSIPATQKIVLDSRDYYALELLDSCIICGDPSAKWLSRNFDGHVPFARYYTWFDESWRKICFHQITVCNTCIPGQNNWLITQYINITDDKVDQLMVNVTFFFPGMYRYYDQCPEANRYFSLQWYETNVPDENGRGKPSFYNKSEARYFHKTTTYKRKKLNTEFPLSATGLYLAVIDSGSCTSIARLTVFYYICPSQVISMVQYPETVSPPTTNPNDDRQATGTCIDNASPVSGDTLELKCNAYGLWEDNDLSCSCNPGYEFIMGSICRACVEGKYKSAQGNEKCVKCPANSNSTTRGSTSCDCITGYYRTSSENVAVQACIEHRKLNWWGWLNLMVKEILKYK